MFAYNEIKMGISDYLISNSLLKTFTLDYRSLLPNNLRAKVEGPDSSPVARGAGMDRFRRSLRDSFRKKKESVPEASKPHQWQHDEMSVRAATCTFPVKYLGCVEVFESRGMQVCEEALKVLRAARRRPVRGILHVSGDGLRVVDDETKGLLVDQTIEKVSFCAPDRNHERGFSYICRDGTTRRWMCHGFVAVKETGERLSHAVGCAFASCLERKQKRDKECGVTMAFDQTNSTFTRMGSFKQMSITERLTDPQECKPNGNSGLTSPTDGSKAPNPHAIARPHATPLMLQRQGSCRVFHHLNESSPFKRQLSLRINELPSNQERQRSQSLDTGTLDGGGVYNAGGAVHFPADAYNNNGAVFAGGQTVSSIPEGSPVTEESADAVSAMCQQLSQGLSLLSSPSQPDPFSKGAAPESGALLTMHQAGLFGVHKPASPKLGTILLPSVEPIREEIPWSSSGGTSGTTSSTVAGGSVAGGGSVSKAEEWLAQLNAGTGSRLNGSTSPGATTAGQKRNPPLAHLRANSLGASNIGQQDSPQKTWSPAPAATTVTTAQARPPAAPKEPPAGGGHLPGLRQGTNFSTTLPSGGVGRRDPFDAEWVSMQSGGGAPVLVQQAAPVNPNNPFLASNSVTKAFEVQM